MANKEKLIVAPNVRVLKMDLSPDLTEKLAAACAISGDNPGEAIQKAINMYADAARAHKKGLFVGITPVKEALTNMWVIF